MFSCHPPKLQDPIATAAEALRSLITEPSPARSLPNNIVLSAPTVRRKLDFSSCLKTTTTGHIYRSMPWTDRPVNAPEHDALLGKRGSGHMVAEEVYQVTDPFGAERKTVHDLMADNALPSWCIIRTSAVLTLLKDRNCYACGETNLYLIDRGSGCYGRVTAVGLKCGSCKEEFRFQRTPQSVIDPSDVRSPLIQNVLNAVSVLFRGNGLSRMNTASVLTGMGNGLSRDSTYRYIRDSGLREKLGRACKVDCGNALKEVISIFKSREGEQPGRSAQSCYALNPSGYDSPEGDEKLLPLSFDGAWSHGRNASVGWGDLVAHGLSITDYVTRYPVVAFHAVQKNRESGRRALPEERNESGGLPHSDEALLSDFQNEQQPRLLDFLGEHGDGSSQTMEHYCFEKCMSNTEGVLSQTKVNARLVIDGDLSIGAQALIYSFISEIGLDMRHFASTFKKRLHSSYSRSGKFCGTTEELITRVQLHLRWCYFTGLEHGWTENEFDKTVVQCVSHWCNDHRSCSEHSICNRSGRGLLYRVSPRVSLHNMPQRDVLQLRENITAALRREPWQKILVEEKSGVNESFHLHLLFHGSSNGKFGNDCYNALLRRHIAVLTWNRGFKWTYKLVLRFLFGTKEVLSRTDWDEIRKLDEDVKRAQRNVQRGTIQKEKEDRRKSADEAAIKLRPFDMSFNTRLIPDGVLVERCHETIGNTQLTALFSSLLLSERGKAVYRSRPKCLGCRLQLPDLNGYCNSCRARSLLFNSGWVHSGSVRIMSDK